MASDIDWTEETVARLRTLWAEGHSTAEIGRRMGTTKNAVIGKTHRLHLTPRASPIRGKGTGTPRKPVVARVRGPSLPPLAAVAGSTPATPASSPPAPPRPAIPVPAPAPQPATVFKPLASQARRAAGRSASPGRAASATATARPCPASPTAPGTRAWPTSAPRDRARPPRRPGARPRPAARAEPHDLTA